MTIHYALTRAEIAEFFLRSLGKSPRLLAIVFLFSCWPAFVWLSANRAFSRPFTAKDAGIACEWACGGFGLFVFFIYLRGKTAERTLTTSELGISTQIGSLKAEIPWTKVKTIQDTDPYVLIVRSNGNAFFIPNRAFNGPDQKAEFIVETRRWRKSS
jgi:hypothetical protein